MTIDKFTVIRSKWGQGMLLTDDGKMCCLGFLSKACGYTDEQLGTKGLPDREWEEVPNVFRIYHGHPCRATMAAQINDCKVITIHQKEIELIRLFANNGITLTFED